MEVVPCKGTEKVGGYSLQGVAKAWDDDNVVRQRLRDEFNLVLMADPLNDGMGKNGHVEKSAKNLKVNDCILMPLLKIMHQYDLRLPAIDEVLAQVSKVYSFGKITVSEGQVYQDSWAIRRLLHYTKSMLYRTSYPKD